MAKEKIERSEFGRGFIYNLILFAKHFENRVVMGEMAEAFDKSGRSGLKYSMWFNGASDHLYELEIPPQWKDHKIGKLAEELRDLGLSIGHGSRMMDEDCEKDYHKVVEMTKQLGIFIDEELGLKPIKGQWE